MTHIIAITNPKGGVGKTTTTISLAGVLADRGQEVLLIDLDPQAHLSLAVGVNPAKVRRSIVDVLNGSTGLYNATRETRIANIDILPSRPELVEQMLAMQPGSDQLIKAFAKKEAESGFAAGAAAGEAEGAAGLTDDLQVYDWVLMDCPSSWNRILLNALQVTDLMLIPTQPEYFSAYNLKTLMELIQKTRQTNPKLAYRILITLQNPENATHQDLTNQIRTAFSSAVFDTAICIDPKLPESAASGYPINHFAPDAPSSRQYAALAEELVRYVQGS